MEYEVTFNQCLSDLWQGNWPNDEPTEDFCEALEEFLETCNGIIDECFDDDWDSEWAARIKSRCEHFGKSKDESFAEFLSRQNEVDTFGTLMVYLEDSDEQFLEFLVSYDPDKGVWIAQCLSNSYKNFEEFYNQNKKLFLGNSPKKIENLKKLWRFDECNE